MELWCRAGSRDFRPFQAGAEALWTAQSLCGIGKGIDSHIFPRDPLGLAALASALREHKVLQELWWYAFVSRIVAASQYHSLDPVLYALMACPNIRKVTIGTKESHTAMYTTTICASDGAIKALLRLPKDTHLHLTLNEEHWFAVADEIRRGRCNIKHLEFNVPDIHISRSTVTETVKVIASAIRLDINLESLNLRMEDDFTEEAGVAVAEALTVNKTLRKFTVSSRRLYGLGDANGLRATAYDAFCAMLRVNTSLALNISPFKGAGTDEKLVESRNRMRIEAELNYVGRGRLLSSSQTPREEWVDALNELNLSNVDESPEFNVSCLYSLL